MVQGAVDGSHFPKVSGKCIDQQRSMIPVMNQTVERPQQIL
nr:MAG TPA: hypothetical protein [Caudoviricetes sp.]